MMFTNPVDNYVDNSAKARPKRDGARVSGGLLKKVALTKPFKINHLRICPGDSVATAQRFGD